MSSHAALLFQFSEEESVRMAFDTLQELGYDPQLHEGMKLHIHVIDEDITSALEIIQSHGGQLADRTPPDVAEALTSGAYGLDALRIPAHTVNEDWTADYATSDRALGLPQEDSSSFEPDDGSYNHFEAR